MVLYRHRWAKLLAGLALGLQLLVAAAGLATAAPSPHCGAVHPQPMNGDACQACGTHDGGTGTQSSGMCKVACAVSSVAAPVPLREFSMQAPRDAVPTSVASLQDQSSTDDLLRPPAAAAHTA